MSASDDTKFKEALRYLLEGPDFYDAAAKARALLGPKSVDSESWQVVRVGQNDYLQTKDGAYISAHQVLGRIIALENQLHHFGHWPDGKVTHVGERDSAGSKRDPEVDCGLGN